MSSHWNAPPGWPIPPEGWVPPEGWQPDPSWPPAPAGWQFTDVEAARPDIEAAVDGMGRTLGVKRELRGLEDRLDDGEPVLDLGALSVTATVASSW